MHASPLRLQTEDGDGTLYLTEDAPRGARILHMTQLEAIIRHVKGCDRCAKIPKKLNAIAGETRTGFSSVFRFHCGETVPATPSVFVSALVRDDGLWAHAQNQVLGGDTTLEALAAQYGHQAVEASEDGGASGGDAAAFVPPSNFGNGANPGASTEDLSELGYPVSGSAGCDHEDRKRAEVSTIALQLALTHYLGGTDAARTCRTLFELADMPSPSQFRPGNKYAGLLAARALILVAFEAHRRQLEGVREAVSSSITIGGQPVGESPSHMGMAAPGAHDDAAMHARMVLQPGTLHAAVTGVHMDGDGGDPLTRGMESEHEGFVLEDGTAAGHDMHGHPMGLQRQQKYRGVYQLKVIRRRLLGFACDRCVSCCPFFAWCPCSRRIGGTP